MFDGEVECLPAADGAIFVKLEMQVARSLDH